MPSTRKLPSIDVLTALREAGQSNNKIAEQYGTTAEAVRQAFARAKLPTAREPRMNHRELIPWRVRSDHLQHTLVKRLRLYGRFQKGAQLDHVQQTTLDNWLKFMEGDNDRGVPLAVHYDYSDPEGFWLEPRRPGDRDLVSPPT